MNNADDMSGNPRLRIIIAPHYLSKVSTMTRSGLRSGGL